MSEGVNGTAPAPAGEAESPEVTGSERVMGAIAVAFAIGLALIGIDMATGGAVSRALTGAGDASAGG